MADIGYKKNFKVLSYCHKLVFHGLNVFLNIQILLIVKSNGTISILLVTQLFVVHADVIHSSMDRYDVKNSKTYLFCFLGAQEFKLY